MSAFTTPLLTKGDGSWHKEQSAKLCKAGDEKMFVKEGIKHVSLDKATSVETAIMMLKNGEEQCDNGVIAVYDAEQRYWNVCWKPSHKDIVHEKFKLKNDEDLETQDSRSALEGTSAVKFRNRHKKFFHDVQLALTVALWCATFGLPFYDHGTGLLNPLFFGDTHTMQDQYNKYDYTKNATVWNTSKNVCPSNVFAYTVWEKQSGAWRMYDKTRDGSWTGGWLTGNLEHGHVWCGFFPDAFEASWANVVQMIVFTVFFTTGQTVQLAFQGFGGILLAVVNNWVMIQYFPHGCLRDTTSCPTGMKCSLDDDTIENFNLMGDASAYWIGWTNALLVLFMFLISRANTNMIMFGMSWHVVFAMSFLNPATGPDSGSIPFAEIGITFMPGNYDSYSMVVLFTGFFGCMLAVLSTIFPTKLLNITKCETDAEVIVHALEEIWIDSLKYMCGDGATGRRLQIAARINSLRGIIDGIAGHLNASWFETFDIGTYGSMRMNFTRFDTALGEGDIGDLMQAVRKCVLEDEFDENHKQFFRKLGPAIKDLLEHAIDLLRTCVGICKNGKMLAPQEELLNFKVKEINDCQEKLYQKKAEMMHSMGHRVEDQMTFSEEYTYAFCASYWSQCMCWFALQMNAKPKKVGIFGSFLATAKDTWDIKEISKKDHYMFAIRNWISITICFYLGANVASSHWIFRSYSSTMAGTLSLLMSRSAGAAFDKNLKRLLGVVLGKVTPLLLVLMLINLPCHSPIKLVTHFAVITLFLFLTTYVYYSSTSWGYVGCLIAGFGTAGLMVQPPCHGDDLTARTATRAGMYKEVIEVTTCIFVQMFVDSILISKSARQLCIESVAASTLSLTTGLAQFFQTEDKSEAHPLRAIRDAITDCNSAVAAAEQNCDSAKPNKEICPGSSTAFKVDLCMSAMDSMKLLSSDLNLLIAAAQAGTHAWDTQGDKANVYGSEDATGDVTGTVTKGEKLEFRQRGEWLYSSDKRGFVQVKDMSISQKRAKAIHGNEFTRRPVIMDLPTVQACYNGQAAKERGLNHVESFIEDKQHATNELLLSTLLKEDEGRLKSHYLAQMKKQAVFTSAQGKQKLQAAVYEEVAKHWPQSKDPPARVAGKANKYIIDDVMVQCCVVTVALGDLDTHAGLILQKCIEANVN